jgi:O-antigen/teichoic acid export membrane protein
MIAGYLFTFLITTQYGASVYGLVVLCFSLFLFLGILGRLGFDINMVRYYSEDDHMNDPGLFLRLLFKSLLWSSFLGLLLYVFRDDIVTGLFSKPDLEPYILWTALAIPFWSISLVCAGLLRARKYNIWFAILNNPARFLFAVIALLIISRVSELEHNAIIAHFIGVLMLSIMGVVQCLRLFGSVSWKTSVSSWKFVRESIPMMLASTTVLLLGWMDTFILGIYAADDQIGIYGVALKIATLSGFIFHAINSILAPKVALLYANRDEKAFSKLIRFATQFITYTTVMLIAGILLFHKWILLLFGDEFITGGTVLMILCIGQLVMVLSGSVGVIMQMTGNQLAYQYIVFIALLLNIALNFTLVPRYGITGAAVATVLSMFVWNIACAVYIQRKLKIQSYFNPFSK